MHEGQFLAPLASRRSSLPFILSAVRLMRCAFSYMFSLACLSFSMILRKRRSLQTWCGRCKTSSRPSMLSCRSCWGAHCPKTGCCPPPLSRDMISTICMYYGIDPFPAANLDTPALIVIAGVVGKMPLHLVYEAQANHPYVDRPTRIRNNARTRQAEPSPELARPSNLHGPVPLNNRLQQPFILSSQN